MRVYRWWQLKVNDNSNGGSGDGGGQVVRIGVNVGEGWGTQIGGGKDKQACNGLRQAGVVEVWQWRLIRL